MDGTDNNSLWEDQTDDASDTGLTDIYNDFMTHKKAVYLINETDSKDELQDFNEGLLLQLGLIDRNKYDLLLHLFVRVFVDLFFF